MNLFALFFVLVRDCRISFFYALINVMLKMLAGDEHEKQGRESSEKIYVQKRNFFCSFSSFLFFFCFNNSLGWNLLRRIFVAEWWKMTILPQRFDERFLFIYVVGRWHGQYVRGLTVYDDNSQKKQTTRKFPHFLRRRNYINFPERPRKHKKETTAKK